MPVQALVADLMFASKLKSMARQAGVELALVRDPAALSTDVPAAVIDLNADGGLDAASRLVASGVNVAGFVSHVDADRIRAAVAAGVDPVMPRSQLPAKLPAWLAAQADSAK